MSDGIPGDKVQDREAATRQAVDLNQLLSRIEALEAEVTYLKNKPAQYVPPPKFGPIPKQQPYPLEHGPFKGFGAEEADEFKKQLQELVNRER